MILRAPSLHGLFRKGVFGGADLSRKRNNILVALALKTPRKRGRGKPMLWTTTGQPCRHEYPRARALFRIGVGRDHRTEIPFCSVEGRCKTKEAGSMRVGDLARHSGQHSSGSRCDLSFPFERTKTQCRTKLPRQRRHLVQLASQARNSPCTRSTSLPFHCPSPPIASTRLHARSRRPSRRHAEDGGEMRLMSTWKAPCQARSAHRCS
mmetsp:Transcript_5721/g.14615  ORF Transcript_5721/g.14615 Transcript_5721/m.14615 type:complete len:208 (+) Transcript_5721:1094-1717(+)